MKKSIFDKKMERPKFKAVYDKVSARMTIGEEIAKLRHKARISQLELARKVHTSRTAIARYESGEYEGYNVSTLAKIAKALHKRLKISFSS
jgi:transcriptional regulator with XRE-family HTH domain